MSYRPYAPPSPLLIGYDPCRDLPADHLARLVEQVVEETLPSPLRARGPGQPPFDPRLPVKVLVYGYATGVRSSRQLERLCDESLPYLFLTRGDTPSYRTLCTARVEQTERIEAVWIGLFTVAQELHLERLGHLVVDSTKLRANASPEAVVTADEYEPLRQELARILEEARQVDERDAGEGRPGSTRLGQAPPPEQMREILRRVRKRLAQEKRRAKAVAAAPVQPQRPDAPAAALPGAREPETAPAPALPRPEEPRGGRLGRRMRRRVEVALAALAAAAAEGRRHLCVTDPDARMMVEGREKKVRECYSFEVAVDRNARLLVAAQVHQEPSDNARLETVVAAAQAQEPDGVKAVDADSGYYSGGAIGRLLSAGVDTCVPDSNTAGDLHRDQPVGTVRDAGRGQVPFAYDGARDGYHCPEGNVLVREQRRVQSGQTMTLYKARRPCGGCPRAEACLTQPQAQHRTLKVGEYDPELEAARQRFNEPKHRERYRHRGEVVETVFGVVRGTLGYGRWLLRGLGRVEKEARLIAVGYQLRKLQTAASGR